MTDTQTIRAVVIDLDGTLLDDQHKLSEGNQAAIRQAIDQGVHIILATGKTRISAEEVITALKLQTPGVFVQGLMIYNADGTIRQEHKLKAPEARQAIQYAEAQGFDVIAYSGNRLITREVTPAVKQLADFGEPLPEAIGPLVNHLDSLPMHKLIVVGGSQRKLNALRWQLQQQIGDNLTFTNSNMLVSLEILPKGASKGNGVKALLRQMGMQPDQVMAIGDAPNDIEMLKLVGLAVAVGNADEKVKAVAQHVVSSNNDDGVAEAIKQFVLKKPETPAEDTPASPENAAEQTTNSSEAPSQSDETQDGEQAT